MVSVARGEPVIPPAGDGPVRAPSAPKDRSGPQPPRGKPARTRQRARRLQGAALFSPAGVLLIGLLVLPVGYTVYLALTNAELIGPTAAHFSFTGTANLSRLKADGAFWHSVILTGVFMAGSAFGSVIVGLVVALLLRQVPRSLANLVSGIAVVAWMLPAVTAAMLWYAFSAQGGTLDALTRTSSFDLLTSRPLLTVVLAMVWATAGFAMLVISAGLRNVSDEILDAAQVDGAGPWRASGASSFPCSAPPC